MHFVNLFLPYLLKKTSMKPRSKPYAKPPFRLPVWPFLHTLKSLSSIRICLPGWRFMSVIADNLKRVQDRIAAAAQRSGRSLNDVTLIVVSKTWPIGVVQEAVDAGAVHLGENRVQEAQEKVGQIVGPISWHLIGHLQRNKVKVALPLFDLIHGVDSLRLAEEISKKAVLDGKVVRVLVQVNTSGEVSKFGIGPDAAVDVVGQIADLEGIQIEGVMTIGAFLSNPDDVRPHFVGLRQVRDGIVDAHIKGVSMATLSMGMSNDFEVAIEEGATMVRVGTAIFGSRRSDD
jgi:pyridoxal phosphate enzyme (YggS family)